MVLPVFDTLIENPAGSAFSACTARFSVASAGRRSGKTLRAKRKGIKRAIFGPWNHQQTPRYAWCAPTYMQAKGIYWDDLKAMTKGLRIEDPKESELMVKLMHGPEIHVVGLDKPQRIEGSPWDGFLIDEVDDLKQGFWEEHLRPCLSDRNGWALLFGVPNGFGRLYEFSKLSLTRPDWKFHTWKSADVLPPREIAAAKADMDERTFRQEYEASFETTGSVVYYAFDRNHNVKDPGAIATDSPNLYVAIDFNVDPMHSVIIWEGTDATYVIDHITLRTSNTDEMIREIKHRYQDRVRVAYPDPTGRKSTTNAPVGQSDHELLRKAGIKVLCRGTVSVRDGINAVNSRLCNMNGQRRLFISPKCMGLVESFEKFSYKEGSSIPDKSMGIEHGLDALRYYVDYVYPIRQRQEWGQ
jgi:hypothetical protein